ncbi:MAG: LacI family DNA-binding transcriptional regulator [Akkermansiaceae bacterium]|nr:LacI family DNA-binding transcriptional regulator [Armatimonadota bacterium]
MKATLREIAREAGVHQSTASHVLNSTGGSTRVSMSTRERILAAAGNLGYKANRAAQQLRTRRSNVIGLLAGDLENPFFARLVSLCTAELENAGYECVLAMRRQGEVSDLHRLQALASSRVDGLLIWSETLSETRTWLEESSFSVNAVVMGYRISVCDSVEAALGQGVEDALTHLIEQGARSIGYVTPASSLGSTGDPRVGIYHDTLARIGMTPRIYTYPGSAGTPEAARIRVEQLVSEERPADRPDALLCFNDMTAIGALMGLRRRGLRVPHDIAIVGCDDLPLVSQMDVPITSISYPLEEISRTAVRFLLERIALPEQEKEYSVLAPRYELIPAPLQVRESSKMQPFSSPSVG